MGFTKGLYIYIYIYLNLNSTNEGTENHDLYVYIYSFLYVYSVLQIYTCIYIYTYVYLEPVCPLFWGFNPPKEGLFQSKQGSFGFQVFKNMYDKYIYLYDFI